MFYRKVCINLLVILIATTTIDIHKDVLGIPLKNDDDSLVIILEEKEMNPIILNCDYPVIESDPVRTVKWSKDNEAIYQWIPGRDPSTIPDYRHIVNDSYEGSRDSQKQYSSLALIKPTIETTGNYKCVVQTLTKTYNIHRKLQVIDVRNYSLHLVHRTIQNETHLECSVRNVFPKPTLIITSDDDDIVTVISEKSHESDDGYFNVTKSAATYDDDDDEDAYKCTASFYGYSFNLTTTAASKTSSYLIGYHSLIIISLFFSGYFSYC